MAEYNESIHFDKILYAEDIAGSIAFARANAKSGIITQDEFTQIEAGLLKVKEEWATGTFQIVPGVNEDIHVCILRPLEPDLPRVSLVLTRP